MLQQEDEMLTRFWSKVINPGDWDTSKCFNWNAGKEKDGYGIFWYNTKSVRAHRFIYEWYHGTVSKGFMILHKCNNPSCVNLEHLEIGTAKDNSEYMLACGRESKLVITSILTTDDILGILQGIESGQYTSITEITDQFSVNRKSIFNLLKGKTWREFTSKYYDDSQFNALYDKIARRYLSEDEVKDIKTRLNNGETAKSIASIYNIGTSFVSRIKLGKSYINIK